MASLTFLQSQGEPVQGSFGGLPVAERNSTYIAYFQSIGGTGPEIIDQSAYFISYLIDEKGNISNPLNNEISLENLYQNFEIGKSAVASLELPTTNNSQLNGEYKITGIGSIEPIVYTGTGSEIMSYITTMSFNSSGTNITNNIVSNFGLANIKDTSQTNWTFNTFDPVTFDTSVITPIPSVLTFDNNITASFIEGENEGGTRVKLEFYIAANISLQINQSINRFEIGLFKNNVKIARCFLQRTGTPLANGHENNKIETFLDGGFINDPNISIDGVPQTFLDVQGGLSINEQFPNGEGTAYIRFNINLGYSIVAGDEFDLRIRRIDGSGGGLNVFGGEVKTSQEYTPSISIQQGSYFWSTGSNNNIGHTWLTASNELSVYYGSNFKQISPNASLDFGYSPISKPFKINPGDNFRFEYNVNRYYKVVEVDDLTPPIKIKVVPKITGNVNLNHFLVYRLEKNGKYVILDIAKNLGSTPGGILKPKYLPKSFEDNYDNVLGILRDKGILKDSLSLGDITN
jgi:hypothetical protein